MDVPYGGRGRAIAHTTVVEALRRRLEAAIPNLGLEARIALLDASWAFSCLPELRPVTIAILETWSGCLPTILAKALHKWPEDVFIRLPKIVRWKPYTALIRGGAP